MSPIPRHPGVDLGTYESCPWGVEQRQERVEARALPHDPPIGEETSEYLPTGSYDKHGVIGICVYNHWKLGSNHLKVVGVVKAEHASSGEPLQDRQRAPAEATLPIVNDVQM
ncbi:MAG TPA: hypothetical protein VHM88_15535 [Candidatus Acidoferrales bacterium]|nr:hypothetical protein [Candidatus Acidoferrales bacterium]